MSFCRWSSDSYRSDLYVYETDDGYVVCVASSRYVFTSDPEPGPDRDSFATVEEYSAAVVAWFLRAGAAVDGLSTVEIGGQHDGQVRTFETGGAAADWVDELAAAGYWVPAGVADELRAEDDAGTDDPENP